MSRRHPERGQATVEWVGLLLGVALLLGAVAAGGREAAKEESAGGLGEAVAERIVCAAKGACGAAARGGGRPRAPGDRPRAPGDRPRAPGDRAGAAPGRERRSRAAPPRERRANRRPSPAPSRSHAGALSGVAKRAWFLCLGYRRWQYDREHAPFQSVPLRHTIKTVNECVNPLSFLFG